MKNFRKYVILVGIVGVLGLFVTGCKTGEGCDTAKYETAEDLSDYNGKRGKSNLFSKKERKKNRR